MKPTMNFVLTRVITLNTYKIAYTHYDSTLVGHVTLRILNYLGIICSQISNFLNFTLEIWGWYNRMQN